MPGTYFTPLHRVFLNLSGGTVTGDTIYTQGLGATYLSGDTIYSGGTDLSYIIATIAAGSGITVLDRYLAKTGGTGGAYYFTGNTTAQTIYVENLYAPTNDNTVDIGSNIRRFRELNVVNGVAVNFTASTSIMTSTLKLGNTNVTENNIVLSGHTLGGGSW